MNYQQLISQSNQEPSVLWVPDYISSAGPEAIDLAKSAGLNLDPWQQIALTHGLGEKKVDNEWLWAAFEVAVTIARQNGKGDIIVARELAGLFLLDEELIIHTAHEFKTASEALLRIQARLESTRDLYSKVLTIKTGKGSEAVVLKPRPATILQDGSKIPSKPGGRLRFLARNQGSGRGFTCNCLILDESMVLGDESMAALLPTLSAVHNPQVWYLGSAGIGEKSAQLAKLRLRALQGNDPSLAYMEWSVVIHEDDCPASCDAHLSVDDQAGWLRANPGLPYRRGSDQKALAYMLTERPSLGADMLARERLTVGDYPSVGVGDSPIKVQDWTKLYDARTLPGPDIVFAADVSADRRTAVISSYSIFDGKGHVELVDKRPGTFWVADRLAELKKEWDPLAIVIDGKGPGKTLISELEDRDIIQPKTGDEIYRGDLLVMNTDDMQTACGALVDDVRQESLHHLGDEVIVAAIQSAAIRPVGDAWVWTRRNSSGDISSLVAVTMARHGYEARSSILTDYDVLQSAY